jgi:hypothetical protein
MSRRFAEIATVNPADVVAGLLPDDAFKKRVMDALAESDKLIQEIINDPRLRERIAQDILDIQPTFIQDITNLLITSTELHNLIAEKALSTQTFIDAIVSVMVNDETLIQEIKQEIINNENLFLFMTNALVSDEVFLTNVATLIVNDAGVINHITQNILADSTLIQNVANQILGAIASLSMIAPDGEQVAVRNGETFTFQAASNGRFGIVQGQDNNTPETWHKVSAEDGLLSINRPLIEAAMDNAVQKNLNINDIIHQILQHEEFKNGVDCQCSHEGSFIDEESFESLFLTTFRKNFELLLKDRRLGRILCDAVARCPIPPLSWQTIDALLIAEVDGDDMYLPKFFFDEKPTEFDYHHKLTFIADYQEDP